MGSSFSGRWHGHHKADTVEDCLVLDVAKLNRDRLLRPLYQGTLRWTYVATGEEHSAVGYRTGPDHEDQMLFTLSYRIARTGESIELPIRLQATYPHLGGRRWWFTCPLVVNDIACRRRVGKLYLPPGGKYYGCRRCYGLTYQSCLEHDKRVDALLKNPAGLDALWHEAMNGPAGTRDFSQALLVLKAQTAQLGRRR